MTAKEPAMYWNAESEPDDDIPDLSTPEWSERFAKATVQRGRPRVANPKISISLRLDADLLERFRATGKGWQGRMNEALRRAAGL